MQPVPYIAGPRGGGSSVTSIWASLGGEDSVVAFATGGQASATALSSTVSHHRVITVVTNGDSVKLPAATVGQEHYVRNDGVKTMQVFGQAGETINGVASATGVAQAPGMGVWYCCTTAGAWTSSPTNLIAIAANGTSAAPTITVGATAITEGLYNATSGFLGLTGSSGQFFAAGATNLALLNSTQLQLRSANFLGWSSGVVDGGTASDAVVGRASANSFVYSGAVSTIAISRTEINKSVTAIADAVATATFTVTIPNASHNATIEFEFTGILGAGGAIGAGEASATNSYKVNVSRTPGVNAVASAVSTAFGAVASNVAGAATVTCTAVVSAIAGAVGATNTFTLNVTITRSGGASTNHVCLCYAKLMNPNATGITIS